MYLSDYLVFILALLACMVFSMIAGGKVKSAYSAYSRVPCRSGLSGRETAERLLRMNGVYDIALGRVSGELTDHYAPNQSIVNLSTGTADSRSVAAAAVAAHEIGHVMQNKEGYGPYRVRTALVPVVNFGSRLAMPLVLIGILLDTYVRTANPDTASMSPWSASCSTADRSSSRSSRCPWSWTPPAARGKCSLPRA